MKKGIHPALHKSVVTCSCGETYETVSTRPTLRVEICSKCHPFFTGRKKIVDTGGRVDRLKRRYEGSTGAYQFSDETPESSEDNDKNEAKK